ncbi:ABC transporter substrate-binding protein [Rhizobium sp. GR12]|uniref:ABC transporter substrate-binding protein n=1 Tax=Rhizobium TaxID=379 RepID=UPI002FBE3100
MRHLLSCVSFAAAVLAGVSLSVAQDQRTLVVSEWGYTPKESQEYLYKPFEEKYNVKVVIETGNNADRLNKMKIRGGVDVMFITDAFSQQGIDDGVFARMDPKLLPNLDDIYDVAKAPQGSEWGPGYTVGRYGIIYDTARVKPITSWKDLWREDLKGHVAVPGFTTTTGPVTVIVAGERVGVDAFADPDAAFKSLAEMKPNIRKTYLSGSELTNLFSTGEVSVAAVQDFAVPAIMKAIPTARWAALDEGAFLVFNTLNIGAKSKNKDLAHAFINYRLSADVQKKFATVGDGTVNRKVSLTPEETKTMAYGPEEIAKLRKTDFGSIIKAKSDWSGRWDEVFGQ